MIASYFTRTEHNTPPFRFSVFPMPKPLRSCWPKRGCPMQGELMPRNSKLKQKLPLRAFLPPALHSRKEQSSTNYPRFWVRLTPRAHWNYPTTPPQHIHTGLMDLSQGSHIKGTSSACLCGFPGSWMECLPFPLDSSHHYLCIVVVPWPVDLTHLNSNRPYITTHTHTYTHSLIFIS